MPTPDLAQDKVRREQELIIQRQIAFASGLFQGDITVRTLLESLAEGVVIIDNLGTILLVNAHAEQISVIQRRRSSGSPIPFSFPNASPKPMKSMWPISSQSPGSGRWVRDWSLPDAAGTAASSLLKSA